MGLVLIASTKQQYDLCSTYIAMITFVIGQLVPKSIITICCCMIDIYLYVSAFPSISSLHKVIKIQSHGLQHYAYWSLPWAWHIQLTLQHQSMHVNVHIYYYIVCYCYYWQYNNIIIIHRVPCMATVLLKYYQLLCICTHVPQHVLLLLQ